MRAHLGPDPLRELAEPVPAAPATPVVQPSERERADALLVEAGSRCDRLPSEGEVVAASPLRLDALHVARATCARSAGRLAEAAKLELAAFRSCSDRGRCRTERLTALASLSRKLPADRRLAAQVASLRSIEGCLVAAERRVGAPAPGCLKTAERPQRQAEDRAGEQRAALIRIAANGRLRPASLLIAIRGLAAPGLEPGAVTSFVAVAADAAARSREPTERLVLLLEADRARAVREEPEARMRVRSEATLKACDEVDAQLGEGRCRDLERERFGSLAHFDFSQRTVDALDPSVVAEVHGEWLPSFSGCLRGEAERLLPPAHRAYPMRWRVLPDGRADQLRIDVPGGDVSPLATCLRPVLAAWRYPRSHGEEMHVEQTFKVTATVR